MGQGCVVRAAVVTPAALPMTTLQTEALMPTTLLFDLDGTLVDTEDHHFEAFKRLFNRMGVTFDRQIYDVRIVGCASESIAAEFLPHLDGEARMQAMNEKEAHYRDLLIDLTPLPGLTTFLDRIEPLGLRRAVVTNAPTANAEKVLASANLLGRFELLVSSETLSDAKPHPLPYLTALKLLDAEASRSVAFEDSRAGLRSAVAAGLTVVGLKTILPEEDILAIGAILAVDDYFDPRINDLVG